jgi:hypothetical protein
MVYHLLNIITILSLLSCGRENENNVLVFEEDSKKGFNFPYMLFIPDSMSVSSELFLIVEPNNSGFADDDLKKHFEKARRTVSKDFYIGNYVSGKLKYPLLVPVFPRPQSEWKVYTHALDRDEMLQKNNSLEHIDIQLINMIDNACDTLRKLGYRMNKKVLMTGFSASGTFVNRFSLIHPEVVYAVAAGGLNGLLMLPVAKINGQELNYPIGISDFNILFNKDFDSVSFKKIHQFLFMGSMDENDAVLFDDAFDADEREIIFRNLGIKMQPERWNNCSEIYKSKDIDACIITYDSIGHEHPESIKKEILDFFRTCILEISDSSMKE